MIAINIGKTFLEAYNQKYGSTYSARGFFIEKYFPLFFDEGKYMQWIPNSPFVQGLRKGASPSAVERKQKLTVLMENVAGNVANASIAIGFPSLEPTATTSGQLTNLKLPLNEEDAYLSWIGSGLGVGVQGGLSILFDQPQLLLDIFKGWAIYRDYLKRIPELKGNQINTWNGQWIAYLYNPRLYDKDNPMAQINGISVTKDGRLEWDTQTWTAVMIGICRTYPASQLTGYVYSIGKTNITIGFIPFQLPQIKRPIDLYEKYFGTSKREEVEHLFGTAFGFVRSCQMGVIGVKAMEPKGLKDYIEMRKMPVYDERSEEKRINFNTYQIWLLAMLNNELLWKSAKQFASTLNHYSLSSEKGKTDKSNKVKAVLGAVNTRQFIESLKPVAEDIGDKKNCEEMGKLVHMMPQDNVPYFLTLVRFHFAIINK